MKIICSECGNIINRDIENGDIKVEEYINICGTYCSKCGFFIKSEIKSDFIKYVEERDEKLKNEMLYKFRKKILGEK